MHAIRLRDLFKGLNSTAERSTSLAHKSPHWRQLDVAGTAIHKPHSDHVLVVINPHFRAEVNMGKADTLSVRVSSIVSVMWDESGLLE